jgi:hypothetical protein
MKRRRLFLVIPAMVIAGLVVSPTAALAAGGNSLNAKSCQKNGWKSLVTTSGAAFASEEACVSYAAKGGALKRAQTISFTSTNPSPVAVGASYTPTATASSGLTVAITLDATSTGCSLSGGVVSFTAAGTCVVDANQAGDLTYNAAAQVQQSVTVTNPPNPSQTACEFYGGTFGSAAGAVWTCSGLPDATIFTWFSPLRVLCTADGGGNFVAISINGAPWTGNCPERSAA